MPATALEQMILELVNRARLDPAAEAARYGIALNEGVPAGDTISTASKQPLAMNETLLGTARAHSQDMIDRDYFAHDTPEGVTPFQRMTNAGYNFTTAGENIASQMTTGTVTNQMTVDLHQFLFVDPGFPGRGHRVNILLGDYQEIGVGQASGEYHGPGAPMGGGNATMLTEDFGVRGNQQFLTGVSYADADHDNFYSIGEGRGSMSVVAGVPSTSTGAAGGYSLAVNSGVQTVSFSGGGLASPINVSVSVAANTNAKVDVIDQGTIATSVSLTDLGGATKIIGLGTFGLALTGDSGNDTIIGTKANDTIDGAGGTDTVVYSGNASAYTRTTLGNGSIQVAGQDGTDTLSNVELLQFADQTIAVGAAAGSIVINDQTLSEGDNGTKIMTFTVTRSGGTAAFAVNFATSNSSATVADGDYVASAGTLNFGASVNTQTISVTINGDTKFEPDEAFSVNLSGATNGATISDNSGIGTITNDDPVPPPSVSIDDVTITEGNAGTKVATFTVTRSGGPAAFAVNFATSDAGATIADHDYVASSGMLSFGTGVNTQKISVAINGDIKIESNETFSINLSGATNGASISDNLGIGSIFDDDGNHSRDFNADGRSDILWQRADGQAAEWQMNGLATTNSALIGPNPGPNMHAIASGDFNGDGHADILWQGTDGTPAMWLMNGTSIIGQGVLGRNPGPNMHAIASGDFNGDGNADILWQGTDGTPAIWLMNGLNIINDGVLSPNPGPNMHAIATGDFNGDGYADILWQGTDGTPAMWLMKGLSIIDDGVLSRNPGPNMHAIASGDFNGDGYSDILWQGTNGTAAIWLMQGKNIINDGVIGFNPGPTVHAVATGDFNNDHRSDILWREDGGTAAMWLMNGLNIVGDGVLGFNPGADWHIIA